jgi:hypothetical protein
MGVKLERMFWVGAGMALCAAAGAALQLSRIDHWNAAIAAGGAAAAGGPAAGGVAAGGAAAGGVAAGGAAADAALGEPRVRFAVAYAQGAQGKIQEALNGYRELDSATDAVIRRNAKFNSGNLYLQLALAARNGAAGATGAAGVTGAPGTTGAAGATGDAGAALTLAELAKQSYRDVLREDSSDWDARYNLELVLRLDPDPDQDLPALPVPPTRNRTPTVGLGSGLGLP